MGIKMANKKTTKKKSAPSKTRRPKRKKVNALSVIAFILVTAVVVGVYYYNNYILPNKEPSNKPSAFVKTEGELSIHFLELGNNKAGDCVYIKAGNTDVLVDAGSRSNSIDAISTYLSGYVTDGVLEYVIATHAHEDHIACFASTKSIFSLYECKTIIDFSNTEAKTQVYKDYVANRVKEVAETKGANHYTVLQCCNQTDGAKTTYELAPSINMTFLYQDYYVEKSNEGENDYSVCFMLTHGEKKFLFTGDLEEKGEESLVEHNKEVLTQVELFKAGHHGSKTSSSEKLLELIKPKMVCVCCCAGSTEYTQNLANTFPTQAFIERVSKYTDKVYVTSYCDITFDHDKNKWVYGEVKSLNGNICVSSSAEKGISLICVVKDKVYKDDECVKLKDSEWYKKYILDHGDVRSEVKWAGSS